jgi:hypothetical protein
MLLTDPVESTPVQAFQEAPSSPWPRQQQQKQQQQPAPAPAAQPHSEAQAAAPPRRVAVYRGLSAAKFQHPLDQQNTALLRVLPGLEMVARNMMGPVAEQVRPHRRHACTHILAWHQALAAGPGSTLAGRRSTASCRADPTRLCWNGGAAPSLPPAATTPAAAAAAALQVLLLENIGTSIRVGPDQLPSLHRLLTEAAATLQMEAPDLYVRQVGASLAPPRCTRGPGWHGTARSRLAGRCPTLARAKWAAGSQGRRLQST